MSSGVVGSMSTSWNRRARAESFSMYLRYSSSVVAPMHWISPRARAGFEHVRGVDRPFRTAGADERVQLVDEQDRVLRAADFVHHRLDPLFELAAVLRAGDHHGQVEHHDPPVHQELRHIAFDHALRKAFDDGRLADARFAQQHGVVLRAAAEDLDRPLDFVLAADHRVELLLASELGEIAAEAVERRRLAAALATSAFFAAFFTAAAMPAPPRPPRPSSPLPGRGPAG